MDIHSLHQLAAGSSVIDYTFLISALSNYRQPRHKIRDFLEKGELIRIKKGLYVFGEKVSPAPYSSELLANLIYGPSAISCEYALSYYGLIPERAVIVTSITNKRNKYFETPQGAFEYAYLSSHKYCVGITQINDIPNQPFLMACKEKALVDYLTLRAPPLPSLQALATHLIENLRIEEDALFTLDYETLCQLAAVYKQKHVDWLKKFVGDRHA